MDSYETLYPLDIYSLGKDEKALVLEILKMGIKERIFTQKELKKGSDGLSFRYIMAANCGKNDNTPDFSYEKWVYLYNYIMGDFRKICAAKQLNKIGERITVLHEKGLESGRYRNDMHLFNKEFMRIDTRDTVIDEKDCGYYIGFRYLSTGKSVLFTVVQIYKTENNRNVYRERVINENQNRYAQGIVYESRGNFYLFGFMNSNGYEYCAVKSDDRDNEILFGISAIVDRHGSPHAKQCCLVRDNIIKDLIDIDPQNKNNKKVEGNVWGENSNLFSALQENMRKVCDTNMIIRLNGNRPPLNLKRHLSPEAIVRSLSADVDD